MTAPGLRSLLDSRLISRRSLNGFSLFPIPSLEAGLRNQPREGNTMIEKKNVIVPLCAIAGIVIIECIALMNGINGRCMTAAIAGLAGIGGFTVRGFFPK